MKEIATKSAKETEALGKKLAQQFNTGRVLALYGNLGAGKTTFIKGIAKGLGIKKIITSPTFVLMKPYKLPTNIYKLKNLVHLDCYRLNNFKAIKDIGALEYFYDSKTITVIEWPEKIKKILPKDTINIYIKIEKENRRQLKIA